MDKRELIEKLLPKTAFVEIASEYLSGMREHCLDVMGLEPEEVHKAMDKLNIEVFEKEENTYGQFLDGLTFNTKTKITDKDMEDLASIAESTPELLKTLSHFYLQHVFMANLIAGSLIKRINKENS